MAEHLFYIVFSGRRARATTRKPRNTQKLWPRFHALARACAQINVSRTAGAPSRHSRDLTWHANARTVHIYEQSDKRAYLLEVRAIARGVRVTQDRKHVWSGWNGRLEFAGTRTGPKSDDYAIAARTHFAL